MSTILKKLEIAGFKSFGKKVELDFGVPVTAIVGPNGSGKSNVSEAIRWVLGEQSMKSLRGKRGEDLIFHGSEGAAELGKARVSIAFDNAGQIFPLDFSEITVSREVYRDGANEYRINDSLVRLKDIIELMSSVGVGGSGHHIIGQGEADRMLYASPRERKDMVEDALGLRIYHIKQEETERKLAATEENMREVAMLRQEIQPHMRFLRDEAAKIEASQKLRDEFAEVLRIYMNHEFLSLAKAETNLAEKERPLREVLAKTEKEAHELRKAISKKQKIIESAMPSEVEEAIRRLSALEEERGTLERDAGRVEGKLAVFHHTNKKIREAVVCSVTEVEKELRDCLAIAEEAAHAASLQVAGDYLLRIGERIRNFLIRIMQKKKEADREEEETDLQRDHDDILHRLMRNEEERNMLLGKKAAWDQARRDSEASFWEDQKSLRMTEEQIRETHDALRVLGIERDRIKMRRDEQNNEKAEAESVLGSYVFEESEVSFAGVQDAESWTDENRARTQRVIQRLRIKLEEAGGVNPDVVKEYEAVQTRDAFLAKELEDLKNTETSLRTLTADLEKELKQEFIEGIKDINKEFTRLFEILFGGGGAELALMRLPRRSEENGEDKNKEGTGLDVMVHIPRKRVKNLDMLSGGERALTSIALLFAMSFVNPPPFLVLDETDAALDEANSQRYGAMLRSLSDKTQLIVITHNRQTMKEAGVLYGVTMGADGVSRLLSLKFEEATEVSGKQHES